jgi:hypothetical protein
MKYSHDYDNKENGFAEIITSKQIKPGSFIGKITKVGPILLIPGNYINLMIKGVSNDVVMKLSILYDLNNDNKIDPKKDVILLSKPISLNFEGFKQVKIKFDAETFKLESNSYDDFTVTEQNAYGIQMDFESGKNYKSKTFESGIALISQIQSKETLTKEFSNNNNESSSKESFFNATNYPNPFNPATTIKFTLPQETNVSVTVYDRIGREVRVLEDTFKSAGTYSVDFDAAGLPSGIYFYRIKTSYRTEVRKMLLSK